MSRQAGEGPGPITDDGCAVDVYVALGSGDEPDLIASAVPAGASILELGSGVGRVTNVLTRRGFDVIAVDSSSEMLAHVRGAQTVASTIEDLDLGRRFDAVLLCSHLVNTHDRTQREAFVASCARHVAPGGCVVIERHPVGWFDTVTEGSSVVDGVEIALCDLARPGDGVVSATVVYRIGERTWRQAFVAERVDDRALAGLLGGHGLKSDRILDDAGAWVRAVPDRAGGS